jgi:fructose-1,6-bisphosphatase/inositol monophosphatase family enzyme
MADPSPDPDELRRLLCALQDRIQQVVLRQRDSLGIEALGRIVAVTDADTIYAIDASCETAIHDWFAAEWPAELPVEVVMEGSSAACFPEGTSATDTRLKCIVDPIDGTRGFMHDKRSAWALAALAPQRGHATSLADLRVAAMTELPPVKQRLADQLSAVRGRGLVARRRDLDAGSETEFLARPSAAPDFSHGFAGFARFFPEGKELLGRFEEALWERLGVDGSDVFEDQYLATGGQLHELLTGRDRMLGDLRPLLRDTLGRPGLPVCHPYDACTVLIAQEAGCVIEDPRGGVLDAPLDTVSPVAWIGFANAMLARRVRPVLDELLTRFFPV